MSHLNILKNDNAKKANNKTQKIGQNSTIVEKKIIKDNGDIEIRKYIKGRLLGKGDFVECYEFNCMENKKVFAGKVTEKYPLVKSRAKQKLLN